MSSTTAATTATKTPPRPQSSHSQSRHLFHSSHVRPQQQIQNPNTTTNSQTTPYPLASTGRGYIPRPSSRPSDPLTYPPRSYRPLFTSPRPHLDYNHAPTRAFSAHPHPSLHHGSRQHPTHYYAPSTVSAPIKGVPVSGAHVKVASSPSPASDSNGYKNTRDRSGDDSLLVTVKDRKVRISEGASLYALCRSWLRNGLPDENQPQYGDSVKSLPRPLPVLDTHSPKKEECEEEVEKQEEDEGPVDQLSPKEILKRHVKRAKKVRARLREERLKRIARYKTRLALLLPPHVEQLINDAAAGN